MCIRPKDRRALDADSAVAQRRAFRRAGDDADVSRCHDDVRCVHDKSHSRQYCTPQRMPETVERSRLRGAGAMTEIGAIEPCRAVVRNAYDAPNSTYAVASAVSSVNG